LGGRRGPSGNSRGLYTGQEQAARGKDYVGRIGGVSRKFSRNEAMGQEPLKREGVATKGKNLWMNERENPSIDIRARRSKQEEEMSPGQSRGVGGS